MKSYKYCNLWAVEINIHINLFCCRLFDFKHMIDFIKKLIKIISILTYYSIAIDKDSQYYSSE